jgi:hypothetical protein
MLTEYFSVTPVNIASCMRAKDVLFREIQFILAFTDLDELNDAVRGDHVLTGIVDDNFLFLAGYSYSICYF